MVVDLAIEDRHEPPIMRSHRLCPVGSVDDGQSRVRHSEIAVDPNGPIVRPAVSEIQRRPFQRATIGRACPDDTGETAHVRPRFPRRPNEAELLRCR